MRTDANHARTVEAVCSKFSLALRVHVLEHERNSMSSVHSADSYLKPCDQAVGITSFILKGTPQERNRLLELQESFHLFSSSVLFIERQ